MKSGEVRSCCMHRLRRLLPVSLICLTVTVGCAVHRCAPGRSQIDAELQSRVQRGLGPDGGGSNTVPPDVEFADGLTPDEAVAVALWNNSAFNAALSQLGIARGDLIQAGLLRNPQFQLFLPGGSKQLEWALFLPIDALLLRERRLDMTEREVCRVAEQLVQNGLDLVRDVRVAHADLAFAHERALLAAEAVELRRGIAELTENRLDAGDISELEAQTAKIAFAQAEAENEALAFAVTQAEVRLKQLMSMGMHGDSFVPVSADPPSSPLLSADSLVAEALVSRPDLRSASFAVAAAQHRAQVARQQWIRFDAVADANSGGAGPSNFGPGIRFDIPIFDRNEGGVHSADWSVQQATQNYNAVRDQVIADVGTAFSQYQQADTNLSRLRSDVLTGLDEAVRLAGKAFEGGGTSYFIVLQTTGQYLDARVREIELTADLRRAAANLDRSIGRNMTWETPFAEAHSMLPEISSSRDARSTDDNAGDVRIRQASAEQTPDTGQSDVASAGILILSEDGSALFSGPADRVRFGNALRSIADQIEFGDDRSPSADKDLQYGAERRRQ